MQHPRFCGPCYTSPSEQSVELSRPSFLYELSLGHEITMLLQTMVDFSNTPYGQLHVELMEVYHDLLLRVLNRLLFLIRRSTDHFHSRWERYH